MCLGFNLGWAELRMIFAHVYRKFEMVGGPDVRYVWFIPFLFVCVAYASAYEHCAWVCVCVG